MGFHSEVIVADFSLSLHTYPQAVYVPLNPTLCSALCGILSILMLLSAYEGCTHVTNLDYNMGENYNRTLRVFL